MALTVLLVDDHELIRHGLRRAFERVEGMHVVADTGTVAEALRLHARHGPDVVVTDVKLPDGDGLQLARRLRAASPTVGIVVLTMYSGDEQLFAALEAGASAFVPKGATSDEVVAAARHAAVSPRSFAAAELAEAMRRRMSPPLPALSPREREILGLLAEGLGVGPIARRLFISESTAKTHVSRIYDKLGAANRAQAIMRAVQSGLIGRSDATVGDVPR